MNNQNHILITIDVEDWFQVENLRTRIPLSSWSGSEFRVEKNIAFLLDLFDSYSVRLASGYGAPKATFFILGWLAKRLPHLIREIQSRGHEIASHGYNHERCDMLSSQTLKADIEDSKKLLEDIIGRAVFGYRAPNFSISDTILKTIHSCGYLYDSSFNSFKLHGRYGHITIKQNSHRGIAANMFNNFYELPISNLKIGNQVIPWGGGAYFRIIPFMLFKQGIQFILKKDAAYLFYMHPWEMDPGQPVVSDIPKFLKFRHYVNLDKTYNKISALIETFKHNCFVTCRQYLEQFLSDSQALYEQIPAASIKK